MAVIYLKHPKYGTKVACLDQEAEYDKEHGWEEYDPCEEVVDETTTELMNTLRMKRRGRVRQENVE